ncbi:MAG: NAD-dependent epimerase/dehydratase family protein [Oligosphaeraceae bacterium]|nr:NAD-dependent epimerase/dehydratase family protein [Oligosphaeraceae bacterium]
MKILFIGGTGNLSLACAEYLASQGHEISILNRGKSKIETPFEQIIADRNQPGALKKALQDRHFDVIADFICFDAQQAETAFEACRGRCAQYIFISTTVVYAKPHQKLPVTEQSPTGNNFSAYGRDKEAAENFLFSKYADDGFPITIVRPSHTYSERWLPNVVSSLGYTLAARLEQGKPIFVHDDGQGLWTLTHVRDFAVGFAGLCGNTRSIGQVYQITSDMVLTWNQIMRETAWALHIEEPEILTIPSEFICRIRPDMNGKLFGDKACAGIFDCAKLKKLVPDFDCRISFRQGIRESVAWFKADPARQTVDPEADQIFDQVCQAWKEQKSDN